MKKWLMILLAVGFLIFFINYLSALSDPSATYCENLGYTYEINNTANGDIGICVISENVKLDAWSFFEGKIGQQYSYCTKKGYSTKTITDGKNAYSEDYAACGIQNNSGFLGFLFAKTDYKSVSDLMNISEDLGDLNSVPVVSSNTKTIITNNSIPSSFDWRNYSGFDFVTPVKNQGSCGSCWAFATVGGVEAKIKIVRNDSSFDVNLAEQDLVSCGVPLGFYIGAGGCAGATLEDPLDYIKNTGIVDQACFPYSSSDEACSDKCFSADKRLWKIDDYGYVPPSQNSIKEYLVSKGPIIVSISVGNGGWNGDVYMCNPGTSNHAVVIVGYNDTGRYWIVKNSWGSNWNGDGYFKIGYGQCNIEATPIYVDLGFNSTQRIDTNNVSVNSGIAEGNYSNLYYKDNLFMNYKCNETNCSYDIQNVFPFSNLSHLTSLDVITYQNSSDGTANLNYMNNNSWSSLGSISQIPYLVKYNLCSSGMECSNLLSAGNILLNYLGTNSTSIDMLYLEAKTYCTDNWTLNDTWSDCQNGTQYKNYYDTNQCWQNVSYINSTETQSCSINNTNTNDTIQNVSFCGDGTCDANESCSFCSIDCGVCPAPAPTPTPAPSGGGSGGSSGGSSSTGKIVTPTPSVSKPKENPPQILLQNQTTSEPVVQAETKKSFSLTGLIVSVQNSPSFKIVLCFIVGCGMIVVMYLVRKEKFSKKTIHRNMMRVKGKSK